MYKKKDGRAQGLTTAINVCGLRSRLG